MLPKSAKLCCNKELNDMFKKVMSKALELGIISEWTYEHCEFYLIKSSSFWGKAYHGANNFSYYANPWICLNEVFLQDPSKAWETLSHEAAHLDFCAHKHDKRWKRNFLALGKFFGVAHYGRLSSSTDIGLQMPKKSQNNNYKYGLKCTICGHIWKYKTNCQAIQHPDRWRHNKCSKTEPLIAIKL